MQATMVERYKKIPQELIERNQWVLWNVERKLDDEGNPKVNKDTGEIEYTKLPYQKNGWKAKATDPNTWTSYDLASKVSGGYSGIGYMLSTDDPYTAIDLDDCIIDGEIQTEAMRIVEALNSYTEYSQSGEGLHIFIKGEKPGSRSKNSKKGIEMYSENRFMIMTGNHVESTPTDVNKRQNELSFIYDMTFSDKSDEGRPEIKSDLKQSPDMEDNEILDIAFKAKNGDKIKALYEGNHSHGSQSEADQSFCNYIAFYTQKFEQIDRIFTNSGLHRPKWDRADYKSWTIEKAINGLNATFQRYELHVKDSPDVDLKKVLKEKRFEEIERMQAEWEENGGKGRKPASISPIRCAVILPEYISFALFDLEENTRIAMYMPEEGIYTRNVTRIKRIISWLEPKLNNARAEDVIYHLSNRADIREKTNSRYLIPVQNGVFNLQTKVLEPFSPEYVFTTKISTPYIENPPAPVIDGWNVNDWLNSIACDDQEIVHLLWQVINDALNGNYSRKKAIFFVGDGNNGKGTFQELITNLIGIDNIATLKVNQFEERFQLGVIEGKTAVIGDDVPANVYIDNSSNFNSVATGDVVQVEIKNKQPYNTAFKCSVIQSTNDMPKFKNKTEGTTRRILIVPFNADFNGKKENLKIKDEYIKDKKVLQYVLHKAINMDFEKFDIPAASAKELETFKQDNDPVLDFKLSVFDEWNIKKVPKNIVYDFYKIFCSENGYKFLSNVQFHKQFRKHLGDNWNADARVKFRYTDLIDELGDLDRMGIGFPDESKKKTAYELNI